MPRRVVPSCDAAHSLSRAAPCAAREVSALVHPYRLSDSDAALQSSASRIARDVLAPHASDVDRSARFPAEAIAALAGAGFHGLCVDAAHGGKGAGMRAFAAVA